MSLYRRIIVARQLLCDAASEAFKWRDYGAAITALQGAWAILSGH